MNRNEITLACAWCKSPMRGYGVYWGRGRSVEEDFSDVVQEDVCDVCAQESIDACAAYEEALMAESAMPFWAEVT